LCVAIAIHIGFLLIDHYLPFTLAQILVPLVSHYSNHTELFGLPLGGIAVTMGILAMYGVVILVATSLGWIDSHARTWRVLHYLSYVVVLLVFFHVAYSGTDVKYGLFRNAWIGLGLVVVAAIAVRLWRAGTTAKIRRAPDAAGTIPVARPDRPE
jgi:DMSO/TMAO reductase YedYZ heme-binding membrane subunit